MRASLRKKHCLNKGKVMKALFKEKVKLLNHWFTGKWEQVRGELCSGISRTMYTEHDKFETNLIRIDQ